jgi:CubicO group peptidase (beta-lactamase class C family)
MLQRSALTALLSFLVVNPAAAAAASAACRPGPGAPAPGLRADDADIKPLLAKLDKAFADLLSTSASTDGDGGDDDKDPDGYHSVTCFSVQVTSEHGKIWETNHLAPHLGDYGDEPKPTAVTGDSIFRVGSISKVFLLYAMHIAGMDFEDSITKYIPEFLDPEGNTAGVDWWKSLTLDKIASQMSGVPRERESVHPSPRFPYPFFWARGI